MSDINNLITPCNIQGELIKNEIDKEQKYNELLKENQKLKIEISARETVCDELQERINKAVEYIEEHLKESEVKIYGIPKCKIFMGSVEDLLDLLKGDKK